MIRLPLSTALSIYVAISSLVMVVLISITLSIRIVPVINASQKSHVEARVNTISSDIKQFIANHQQLMFEHARQPLVIQTVMQPEIYKGRAKDFMQDLTFLGNKYSLNLLDFQGNTIHSTQTKPYFNYSNLGWIDEMINLGKGKLLEISVYKDQYYLRLAHSIDYNQYAEGILVVEIPVTAMTAQVIESRGLQTLSLQLIWQGKEILKLGDNIKGDILEHGSPVPDLSLRYLVDKQEAEDERIQLIVEITLLSLGLSLVMALVIIWVGKKWFVNPIEQLKKASSALATEQPYSFDNKAQNLIELDDLQESFRTMSGQVHKREKSLQQRRDELVQVNEELKLSQAQLVHSEKMASLGTLAAGVAHEINNPIGFIKNNLAILQEYMAVIIPLVEEYCRDASKQANNGNPETLEKIKQCLNNENLDYILRDISPLLSESREGTERVKDIVTGLKTFAHIDDVELQYFDLNECVNETLRIVWNELKYNSEVTTDLEELPQLYGNAGKINQVIMNLLVNASHAIEKNGQIQIKTWCTDENIFLSVSDNGSGIEKEHIKDIFAPFFTTKEVNTGTGLGLSISHGIVQEHSGEITVESEIKVGTTFTLSLPVTSSESE